MCGLSVSSLVLILLFRYSIDAFGWRGGMLIMAGVGLNGCVCGMLFVPNIEKKTGKMCKALQCNGLRDFNYFLFLPAFCLSASQISVIYLLSTSRAVTKGLSKMEGSMLISCIGVASTVARFITSWVSNMKCTSHIGVFTSCTFILSGLIAASCIWPENLFYSGVMACLCGLMIGKI